MFAKGQPGIWHTEKSDDCGIPRLLSMRIQNGWMVAIATPTSTHPTNDAFASSPYYYALQFVPDLPSADENVGILRDEVKMLRRDLDSVSAFVYLRDDEQQDPEPRVRLRDRLRGTVSAALSAWRDR